MDTATKIRLLEGNAAKFRRLAHTDRPGRDEWLRRAAACDAKIKALKGES